MSSSVQNAQSLGSILIESGVVDGAQIEQARARQRANGGRLGEAIVDLGFAGEEAVGRALAKALGVPYTNVDLSVVDPAVMARFPEGILRRALAMPLIDSGGQIVVAMADPTDRAAVADLRSAAGAPVSVVVGAPAAIRRALAEFHAAPRPQATEPSPRSATTPVESARPAGTEKPAPRPAAAEKPARPKVVAVGAATLHKHLEAVISLRASEVHFVPLDTESVAVFYRGDSGLEAREFETPDAMRAVREQLHALGVPDLARPEDSLAQGAGALAVGGVRVQFQASHCRSAAGVATVLRIGPRLEAAPQLSTLGLTPLAEAELFEICEGPEGIVIVYGPPRSGGSTVLASLAALASRQDRRVLVLEPAPSAPYPGGVTRVRFGSREQAVRVWTDLLLGQGADVMALDDVLHGEAIEAVLSGATVGRLVFARTDWLDGRELLQFLARSRHARSALHDRPFVLIGLPGARREGTAVWSPAVDGGIRPGTLNATLLSLEERDALLGAQ